MNTPDYNSMRPEQLARAAVPYVKKIKPGLLNRRNKRERKNDAGEIYEIDAYQTLRDISIITTLGDSYTFSAYILRCINTYPNQVFAHAKKMIGEREND